MGARTSCCPDCCASGAVQHLALTKVKLGIMSRKAPSEELAALTWLTSHVTERFGIRCAIGHEAVGGRVSSDLEVLLFQGVREVLMNVVKHSGTGYASFPNRQEDVAERCMNGILRARAAAGPSGGWPKHRRHSSLARIKCLVRICALTGCAIHTLLCWLLGFYRARSFVRTRQGINRG